MNRRHAFSVVTIALSVLSLERAQPAGQTAPVDHAVPFKIGEVLTYDVSWSTYLTAATATMTVKERRPGGTGGVYDLVAEGRPASLLDKLYHVYYKAESLLDTRSLQPSVATVFSDERGRQKIRSTRFTGRTTVEFEPKANAPVQKHTTPPLSQDPLSAMYVIRALPMNAGQVFVMPVVDGSDIYNVRWQVAGPEPLTTPMGAQSAWRLTPGLSDAQGKPISNKRVTLWLSNDARRLPLKIQVALPVGNFVLTLARVSG